ncbi:alpha-L-glutamate ligase-like protein [Thiococcus pfennigii]|uniref:alpha-L-glutamate ligase-like protein n=1 Tax=Thiococcus pfennigii TaxID=1057 RepID=UPI00190616BD|nr:alpha-L-glutamate ligase-like protein [Thiococcus pfennigii]
MIRLISPRELARLGILGMNQRNHGYIGRYNRRQNYQLVDNKLKTKAAALANHIPVPELYGVIEHQFEVRRLDALLAERTSFVMKPVQGSGGKGILVIAGRRGGAFIKTCGTAIGASDLRRHASNTLAGLYSLGGRTDHVMIESLIEFDPQFAQYSYEGVPDVRVIIYKGVPVMAMIRCATHRSGGKANLHQGAVGVGLDMATGRSICAVQQGRIVDVHPDTGARFDDLRIPHWERILDFASRCAEMTGLGYLGADIVFDYHKGPMLLELNARPGLAIQLANQCGLRHRLRAADRIAVEATDRAERVRLAQQRFGVACDA